MVNKEFFAALADLVKEKGISEEAFIETLKNALASAYKKQYEGGAEVLVELDPERGTIEFKAIQHVVAEVVDRDKEISVEDAQELNPAYKEGDEIVRTFVPKDFGRIAAQTAKQVILQKLHETERDNTFSAFSDKEGELMEGVVRKLDDGSWQMVSGHRRKAAYAMLAEEDERYAQIPCRIIRGISDEQSVMLLHAANYFVRNLTVTERAAASRALGMEVERMRVENPELSGMRTEDIKAAIISEQTGRKVSGKTIQRQESLARKIEEDLVAGWREAALSDSLSADAVNALAKMEPDEQERLFSSWKEHPLDKKKTTEFLRKATSESSAKPRQEEEQKPSAPLGSALRALRRYESKALGEPSELDRQALGEIAETAEGLLGGR